MDDSDNMSTSNRSMTSLRKAIWRGSSIIAPPLVTLLLLIWLANAIEQYVLLPLETAGRTAIVVFTNEIKSEPPPGATLIDQDDPTRGFIYDGMTFVQSPVGRKYLPDYIMKRVDANIDELPAAMQSPRSASNYYHAYVKMRFMPRWFTIPLLLLVLLSLLYFVGRFLAAGVGRFFVTGAERIIHQLPLVRNLYSSVKQVTDFVLSEREIEFTRVVVVEYPRVGIWSLGFVTSDSLPPLSNALNEEMVSVFMPTSPMPMTGFTINVRKREVIDMELSIDQAIQFIVSCGVVCPPPLKPTLRHGSPALLGKPESDDESS